MTRSPLVVACVAVGVAAQLACAARTRPAGTDAPVATEPSGASEVVALLPDDDGSVGQATVSNAAGVITLEGARASTRVVHLDAPTPVAVMSEGDVERLFGEVLAGLPSAPQHFTLHFRFESDRLTAESEALVAEILRVVSNDPAAEVAIVGHTDTMGRRDRNYALGLSRANTVRDILVAASLRPSSIEVTSHGEADPAVRTRDDVSEPRNRRVDITIR